MVNEMMADHIMAFQFSRMACLSVVSCSTALAAWAVCLLRTSALRLSSSCSTPIWGSSFSTTLSAISIRLKETDRSSQVKVGTSMIKMEQKRKD